MAQIDEPEECEGLVDRYADERLTTVGLLFEVQQGLADVFTPLIEAQSGVSTQLFEILIRLARSPHQRLRMSDLAAQVAMSPSGLTRAVDRLEAAGLVERALCPTDRRGMLAVLTPAGLARVDAALPGHLADIEAHLTGRLEPAELAAFAATLRKLRDHLRPTAAQFTPPPDQVTPPPDQVTPVPDQAHQAP
jgi:MarR family 2-MHQ and catechol resistance regulon transcriptional repressor